MDNVSAWHCADQNHVSSVSSQPNGKSTNHLLKSRSHHRSTCRWDSARLTRQSGWKGASLSLRSSPRSPPEPLERDAGSCTKLECCFIPSSVDDVCQIKR